TLPGGAIEFLNLVVETMTIETAAGPTFVRGDSNFDGNLALTDGVVTLTYLFNGGTTSCLDALDFNDDGSVNLQDPVLLLGYLFSQGTAPPPPFPTAGFDPTPDGLTCL
ncbi:MAG: hypothetical protein AAF581_23000, partial [Planctomycetota bacterium]